MDQSVYVRKAIESLAEEGVLGAVLCSLVILIFLGEWRMTVIAVLTIPVAVLGAIACLYGLGQTINLMTLAGLALAIGPLVDSAIICLENTHRHLGLGAKPQEAAFLGASEVALPELVASLCTLLVLLPLALMPGLGAFLFRPMFLAVAFAMVIAYLLSRTFVPARCAAWLRSHGHKPIESHTFDYEHRNDHENAPPKGPLGRLFEKWESVIDAGIAVYTRLLGLALQRSRRRDRRRRSRLWPASSCCSARTCAGSSSRRSMPVRSRSSSARRPARGSRRPRRRSPWSRVREGEDSATTWNWSSARSA